MISRSFSAVRLLTDADCLIHPFPRADPSGWLRLLRTPRLAHLNSGSLRRYSRRAFRFASSVRSRRPFCPR